MKLSHKTITNIVSLGGVGFWPKAPGSWGSLVTVLGFALLQAFNLPEVVSLILAASPIWVFGLGWWASNQYQAQTGKQDASEIVIDEMAGQLLTLYLLVPLVVFMQLADTSFSRNELMVGWLATSFISFRFFDMLKPWPISWADRKWKGGFGVMFDDILAAIMAALTVWIGFLVWPA